MIRCSKMFVCVQECSFLFICVHDRAHGGRWPESTYAILDLRLTISDFFTPQRYAIVFGGKIERAI